MNEILLRDIVIHPIDSEYPMLLLVLKFIEGDVARVCVGDVVPRSSLRSESIITIR